MRRIVFLALLFAAISTAIAQDVFVGPSGSGGPASVIWSGASTPGNCSIIQSSGPPVVLVDAGAPCLLGSLPLCSGTPIHLTSPNDLTNAAWGSTNITGPNANTQTDPFGGSTAGDFAASGAFSEVHQLTTLSINTTYEVSYYFKSSVPPQWLMVAITDSFANSWGTRFGFATGYVGSNVSAGGGSVTCSLIQSVGNGWYYGSIAGTSTAYSNAVGGPRVFLELVNAPDGSNDNATAGQKFFYYTVGP